MRVHNLLCSVILGLCLLLTANVAGQVTGEAEELSYADRLYQERLFDLAALQYQRYAERYPTSPKAPLALLQACRAFSGSGQHEAAERVVREALLRYPDTALLDQLLFEQGKAHVALEHKREAAITFERVAVFVPTSPLAPESLMRAGRLYQQAGDLEAAQRAVLLLLDRYPTNPLYDEARLLLASVLFAQGQHAEALAEANKVATATPKSSTGARALVLKAEILERGGQFTEAERLLATVAESTADSAATSAAAFRLGSILHLRGQYEQSTRLLDRAAQFSQDRKVKAVCMLLKGRNLLRAGAATEALAALRSAASSAPNDSLRAEAWCEAGNAALEAAQFETALQHFDAARTLPAAEQGASERAIATATVGAMRALVALGRPTMAHERATQFLARFPSSPFRDDIAFLDAHYTTGEGCSYHKIRSYLGFLTQYPQSHYADDAALAVARCYQALGEYQAAAEAYDEYARQFPAAPPAEEASFLSTLLRSFFVTDYRKAASSLALQVVRLASGQETALVPQEVASLYLVSLKDYRTARALYRFLCEQDTTSRATGLLLNLATCYHGLAAEAFLSGNSSSVGALADTAAGLYRQVFSRSSSLSEKESAARGLLSLGAFLGTGASESSRRLAGLDQVLAGVSASSSLKAEILAEKATILASGGVRSDSLALLAPSWAAEAARLASDDQLRARAYWLLAKLSLAVGDTAATAHALRTIVDRLPHSRQTPQALMMAGALAERQGDLKAAESCYARVLRECYYAPLADTAAAKYADILIRQGRYQQAAELLQGMRAEKAGDLSLSPTSTDEPAELKLRLALAYHKQGRTREAEVLLAEFARQAPDHQHTPSALFLLADLNRDRGDTERALAFLGQILTLPNVAKNSAVLARLRRGQLLFHQGDYRPAATEFQELLKMSPPDSVQREAWSKLVICFYRLDDRARASSEAEKYFKSYRDDAASRALFAYEEGEFFVRQKDFKQAEKSFRAAREVKNAETAPWGDIGLGKIYLLMNQPDEALKVLADVPTRYPNSPLVATAYLNLGDFYFKNGQFENAFLAFQKAGAVPRVETPVRALVMGYLIDAADRLGMWDRAISYARQYLEEFPTASDAFTRKLQIGTFLRNLKDYERAIDHLRKLKRLASREAEPEVQYWIGKCYLEMGRYQDAIVELMKVKYLSPPSKLPWDVTAMYESGLAYMRLGQLDSARRLFERIEREQGSGSTFGRVARERIKEIDQRLKESTTQERPSS